MFTDLAEHLEEAFGDSRLETRFATGIRYFTAGLGVAPVPKPKPPKPARGPAVCPRCSKGFERAPLGRPQIYCSEKCQPCQTTRNRAKGPPVIACGHCGVTVIKARRGSGTRKYCSVACRLHAFNARRRKQP